MIPVASTIIKRNTTANLFAALRTSTPWMFNYDFRIMSMGEWKYGA